MRKKIVWTEQTFHGTRYSEPYVVSSLKDYKDVIETNEIESINHNPTEEEVRTAEHASWANHECMINY